MSNSIHRILFPTDFSEPAKHAQKYAMAFADRFGAELHLLHVVPVNPMPFPDNASSWTLATTDQQWQVEATEKHLLQVLEPDWSQSHRTVRAAVIGIAVEEIMKYATQHQIDLIVIGTHGRTGLSHLLLGSVAEKLVRLATCPVLSVHPQGHQFVIDDTTRRPASAPT